MMGAVFVLLFVVLLTACKTEPSLDRIYPTTAEVVELNHEKDIVLIETHTGFQYEFSGIEDWRVGDMCSLIMDKNGTDVITDDSIVSVKYAGISQMYPSARDSYLSVGVVVATDYNSNYFLVSNHDGRVFSLYGAEDWCEGDLCAMVMHSAGTEDKSDDEVLVYEFAGIVEEIPWVSIG